MKVKNGDKLVYYPSDNDCVNTLIIGKCYIVNYLFVCESSRYVNISIEVASDDGFIYRFPDNYFITVDEYRERILNKLI